MKVYIILMALFSVGFALNKFALANKASAYFELKFYISVAIILAFGSFFHNPYLFNFLSALVLILMPKTRLDALCKLVVFSAIIPNIDCFISTGSIYIININTVSALGIGALIYILIRSKKRIQIKFGAEDLFVFSIILIFGLLASRDGNFTGIARSIVAEILEFGLPYILFSRFIDKKSDFTAIAGAFVSSAIILSVIAIYEARFHWSTYYTIYSNQSVGAVLSHSLRIRSGLMRTPTSFAESTSFAIFQFIGILAIIGSRDLFRTKLSWICVIGIATAGLLLAQSRGADLALLVALLAWQIARRRYAIAGLVAVGASLAVAGLLLLARSIPKIASFVGTEKSFQGHADYRQALLEQGLKVGMAHPIFGDDMTVVASKMTNIIQGEGIVDFVNSYLVIFLSSGIVGLLIFAILAMQIIYKLHNREFKIDRMSHSFNINIFIFSALIGDFVAIFFTSMYERNPYWFMILIAGAKISQRRTTIPT